MARPRKAPGAHTVVEEMIQIELKSDELIALGKEHAEILNALDVMRDKHKDVKKKLKLEDENATERERDLRTAIVTGKQARAVECHRTADFGKGIATIRRADTGDVVRTEKLGDDERQTDIENRADELAARGVLANDPHGRPIRGTAEGEAFAAKVAAEVGKIKANPNAKDIDPGEGVTAPPDGLADES